MSRKLSVSVCLASYNGEKYIEEQILSILNQFKEGDELIVSDDGSTDRTVEIVKELQKNYPMISIYSGPKMGFSCNFGNAAIHAKCDVVMYSDQDDIWCENKIERVCQEFQRDLKCTTVFHAMRTFDEEKKKDMELFQICHRKGVLKNFIKSSYWGCCIAVRRGFLQSFLPFRNYCVGHDQLTGLMSEKYGKVIFLDEKLIYHRVHGDNVSLHRKSIPEIVKFRYKLFLDYCQAKQIYKKNKIQIFKG